jgi:homoserine kinase type II
MLEMLWEAHDPRRALRIVISDHNALAWVETQSGRLLAKWSVVRERFPHWTAVCRSRSMVP